MPKTLTVNGVTYPLDTQKTLLENLESQSITSEYNCRDGYCGACRCTLIEGTVNYSSPPIAYLRANDILTCCSKSQQSIEITTT